MKWKRSKKAAQEAKQSGKSPSDTVEAKSSDNEFDSDSSRNFDAEPKCKSNSSTENAQGISLFKSVKSSSENDPSLSPSKWNPNGMSRHLVDCARSSMGTAGHGVIVSSADLPAHSHHRPSMVGESFYRHFVS